MPSSTIEKRFIVIGIHKVPAHSSLDEFRAKITSTYVISNRPFHNFLYEDFETTANVQVQRNAEPEPKVRFSVRAEIFFVEPNRTLNLKTPQICGFSSFSPIFCFERVRTPKPNRRFGVQQIPEPEPKFRFGFVKSVAERAVLRYFSLATGWRKKSRVDISHSVDFIRRSITLVHEDTTLCPGIIVLRICRAQFVEESIYRQKLTGMFVTMSGAVITVPYADLAFRSLSLVNHEYVDLDSQDDLDAAKLLCDNARHSGFTVVGYHSSTDGECGTDLTCPAIVRTSIDQSSFSAVFASREWGNVGHSKRSGTGVVWSLGAKGCAPHGPSHTSFVSQMDVVWPRHSFINVRCRNYRPCTGGLDALSVFVNMRVSAGQRHGPTPQVETFADAFIALPAAQKHCLKYDLIVPNDKLDDHTAARGFLPPQPLILVVLECKVHTKEHCAELLRDGEVARSLSDAAEFGEMSMFSTDEQIRIDSGPVLGAAIWVGIYSRPSGLPTAQFRKKVEEIEDMFVAFPITKTNVLKHVVQIFTSQLFQNDAMANELQPLSTSVTKSIAIVMDHVPAGKMREMAEYDGFKQISSEMRKADLSATFNCFGADIFTKFEKN
ncbi:hypothetical protein C8R47DRAFT_1074608 [Mycena vitilis]|nr:hypothetical protein C8R47DRAFT_1074608 [Mycena vitilis]